LIRIAASGVCGSDIHYYTSGRIGDQIVQYPYIVGHECAGTVEEIGPGVSHVKPGDRVAIDPAVSCGECAQCCSGRSHTCENLLFLGNPGEREGSLAEYLIMPEKSCFPLKKSIALRQGVLVEPLSIGIYAVGFLNNLQAQAIAILGSGPIGLSVLVAAREKGFGPIYATDKIDDRLSVTRKAGANWAGNPDTKDVVGIIKHKKPDLLDAVFECCGEQEAIAQAVELLKPGGTLIIVGIPQADDIRFDIHALRRKEIRIQNVRRQNNCMMPAIELIDKLGSDLDFMITHVFPFDKTREAFELVEGYQDGVIKAIIEF
jgi:L-iditol 2-dehydrogenase